MERKLDLIDRNALYEKAYFHGKLPDPGNLYPDGKEAVDVDDIDDAPSIDAVEVVHSMWILNDDGSGTCKNCHRTTRNCWDYDSWMNYCPNCGAQMDGGN